MKNAWFPRHLVLFTIIFFAGNAKADTLSDLREAASFLGKKARQVYDPYFGNFKFDEKSEKGQVVLRATQIAYDTLTVASNNLSKALQENPQSEFATTSLLKTITDTRSKMAQKYIKHRIFYALNEQDDNYKGCQEIGAVAFEHGLGTKIKLPITKHVELATSYIYLCDDFFDPSEKDTKRGHIMVHESLHVNGENDECELTKTHILIQYWVGVLPDEAFPYIADCNLETYKASVKSKLKQ